MGANIPAPAWHSCHLPRSLSLIYPCAERRLLTVMKAKLTGNSSTDEKTKEIITSYLKCHPDWFKSTPSISFFLSAIMKSLAQLSDRKTFLPSNVPNWTTSHCRSCLIKGLSFFHSPLVSLPLAHSCLNWSFGGGFLFFFSASTRRQTFSVYFL